MRFFSRSLAFLMLKMVAIRATRRVANHNDSFLKHTKANDSPFAVIPASVLGLECRTRKHQSCILKVESAFGKGGRSLLRIEGDCHRLLYLQ